LLIAFRAGNRTPTYLSFVRGFGYSCAATFPVRTLGGEL
jgi:hypothetical protein